MDANVSIHLKPTYINYGQYGTSNVKHTPMHTSKLNGHSWIMGYQKYM